MRICCWCKVDTEADGEPVRYAGIEHPACKRHSAQYNAPLSYSNEDFDRINAADRNPDGTRKAWR